MKYFLAFLLIIPACRKADKDEPVTSPSPPVPGPVGPTGPQGAPGTAGASCSTTQLENGVRIDCENGTHSVVYNGLASAAGKDGINGADGAPGQTGAPGAQGSKGDPGTPAPAGAFMVESVIDPCNAGPGFNEVLLKLADGHILAHYADKEKQFLTFIGPGNYVTTDGTNCYFTVTATGDVTW